MILPARALLVAGMFIVTLAAAHAEERQITHSPKNHNLDNNDNFSPDDRDLCYDTREMIGPGIENSQSVEKVEIGTGEETVLYAPAKTITGAQAAPGIGAVSYSFQAQTVVFIHGPPLEDLGARGYYGKPNRNGAVVAADGSGHRTWLDHRDIATDRDTLPGAHRGGTHRHEHARTAERVGFTYDDFLLPEYDRTVGYLEKHPDAPADASHYFAILVPVTRKDSAKPGEIEKAYGDSWITPGGTLRAFIGKVRNDDGETYEESLFTVEIPAGVDITTADSGSSTRYPTPPEGTTVRRITHDWAGGILRGSHAGDRIAYYGKDSAGVIQLFVVAAKGSDRSDDAELRPKQITRFTTDAGPGVRWHPSGDYLACIHDNAIAVTHIATGETRYLTERGDSPDRFNLVLSHDGETIAYNKTVAHPSGAKNYDDSDPLQIFTVAFKPWR